MSNIDSVRLPYVGDDGEVTCPDCNSSLLLVQRIIVSRESQIAYIDIEKIDKDITIFPTIHREVAETNDEEVEILESRVDCSNLNCEYFIESSMVDVSIYD